MRRNPVLLTLAALCAAGFAARHFYPDYQLHRASALLNDLYAARRPFSYRWPGAPWSARPDAPPPPPAPLQPPPAPAPPVKLGRNALAPVLLVLNALAPTHAADPGWLRLNARASLLEGQYDRAITQYHRAQLLSPHPDRDLSAEIAAAYALRGESEHRASDFGPALENISLALNRPDAEHDTSPVSAATHFNAALILREAWLLRTSAEQWTAAANAESGIFPGARHWKREASDAGDALRRFFARREAAIARLNDPAKLNDADLAIPGGLEVAQQAAVERWISMTPQPRAALGKIAKEFKEKHGDLWWTDFLAQPSTPDALRLLSRAEAANGEGKHAEAQKVGAEAEAAFRKLGNDAGRLRARWEQISASRTGDRVRECPDLLRGFDADSGYRAYHWMQATSWLESITCQVIIDKGGAFDDSERAYENISRMNFEGISLRALAFLAEPYSSSRIPQRAWNWGTAGLHRYWVSSLAAYRVESFAWSLAEVSGTMGSRNSAVAAMREAVANSEASLDHAFNADLIGFLAASEAKAGLFNLAEHYLSLASTEWERSAPGRPKKLGTRLEIERANTRLDAGQGIAAVGALEKLLERNSTTTSGDEVARADLLNALGLGLLRLGRYADAASRFSESIACYSLVLSTLSDRSQRESVTEWYASAFRGLTEARIKSGASESKALASWQAFRRARGPGGVPDATTVPPGTGTLTVAVLPDGVSVWFADSHGIEQRWADLTSTRKAAESLSGLASDPEVPTYVIGRSARELGRLLIGPLANRLGTLSASGAVPVLLIDADDFLAGVPWSLVENLKGEPLIERYSIVRTFNPSGYPENRVAVSAASKAVVFADPDLGDDKSEFPGMVDARDEGKRIAARFRNSVLLEGPGASREAFLRALPNFQLLHFEGHGMANGGFGGLVLSGKPPLVDAEQISHLDLSHLSLAVLAGCSTGIGLETGSANADTLVRGFLDAGAARVVAASWDTDSFASRQLMDHFYDELLGGATASGALRRAMLALRAQAPTSHPSAWAAFQLYGSPESNLQQTAKHR